MVTWKSAQKMCKRWLEAGPPQFRTQADSIKNCLDLEHVITCLITKKGLPKTGGRSALQISLERTSWLVTTVWLLSPEGMSWLLGWGCFLARQRQGTIETYFKPRDALSTETIQNGRTAEKIIPFHSLNVSDNVLIPKGSMPAKSEPVSQGI